MKANTLVLLPAVVSAAVLQPRQFGLDRFGHAKVDKITQLTPEIRPDAIHHITRYGPYKLKAKTNDVSDGEHNFLHTIRDGFCRDCTVLKGHASLEYNDGTSAAVNKGVYIHHILTYDTTKEQKEFVNCSEGGAFKMPSKLGSKFIGMADNRADIPVWYTSSDGKHDGGYFIGPQDEFMVNADLVNSNPEETEVYISIELEYLNGQIGSETREALLSVTGCGSPRTHVDPAGPTNTTSGAFTIAEDGQIIFAKGHLNDGGDRMVLNINGNFVCQSQAKYDTKDSITDMSVCSDKPIGVKQGDILTMTAVYNASKQPVQADLVGAGSAPDVMGMFAIAFSGPGKA